MSPEAHKLAKPWESTWHCIGGNSLSLQSYSVKDGVKNTWEDRLLQRERIGTEIGN